MSLIIILMFLFILNFYENVSVFTYNYETLMKKNIDDEYYIYV